MLDDESAEGTFTGYGWSGLIGHDVDQRGVDAPATGVGDERGERGAVGAEAVDDDGLGEFGGT